jgi:hypothetical protein
LGAADLQLFFPVSASPPLSRLAGRWWRGVVNRFGRSLPPPAEDISPHPTPARREWWREERLSEEGKPDAGRELLARKEGSFCHAAEFWRGKEARVRGISLPRRWEATTRTTRRRYRCPTGRPGPPVARSGRTGPARCGPRQATGRTGPDHTGLRAVTSAHGPVRGPF